MRAEYEERVRKEAEELKAKAQVKAEPLINQVNDLHKTALDTQCGWTGCRKITSSVQKMYGLIDQIKAIDSDIANSVISKLNESTEKQKKCNCMTMF